MRDDDTRTSGGGTPADGPRRAPDTAMPASIGRYRILGKLGEGGMGVVYEAEQESPRRRVAVKVVRGGHAVDEQQVRMFQREAATLARLDHPDIASIYESGCTEDGRHFFAMELVRGRTLREYLASRPDRRTDDEIRFRLALIARIASAVHYAHQRGVIHRDLKPSNIVVVEEPEESRSSAGAIVGLPRVKILDFGLARITEEDIAATMTTEMGAIKGTLAYMAPEQAGGHPEAIDVRSDVYALGVMLYEALAGCRPYDVAGKALAAAVRAIEEEAPRPLRSTREDLRRLDADVATIVTRTLEKEPDRRYGSAQELAGDLERYLTSQPILARPPSARYQLRKMIQRNRAPAALVALLLLAVVGFGIGMAALFARASAAERKASREARTAEQALEFMTGMFEVVDPEQALGNVVTAREVLDNGARRIASELGDEPEIRAALQTTMGEVYAGLGLAEPAVEQLEHAVEQRRALYGDRDPRTFRSVHALAAAWSLRGRDDKTVALLEEALAPHADDPAPAVDVLSARRTLANSLRELGRNLEGAALLEETLATARAQLGPDHRETVGAMSDLVIAYRFLGRLDEAESLAREALQVQQRIAGPEHPDTFAAMNNLGFTLVAEDRFEEAEALLREGLATALRVYGPGHPDIADLRLNLAELLRTRGEIDRALAEIDAALEELDGLLPADHPTRILLLNNRAAYLQALGRNDEAAVLLESTFEEARKSLGEDHPLSLNLRNNLGTLRLAQGDAVEAERILREVYEAQVRSQGPESPDAAATLENVANAVYTQGGRVDEVLEMLERVREIRTAVYGAGHATTSRTRSNIATVLKTLGRMEEARAILEEELAIQVAARGEQQIDLLNPLTTLADVYVELGDYAKAEKTYDRALSIQREALGEDAPAVGELLTGISRLYRRHEQFELAEARARQAVAFSTRVFGATTAETLMSRYQLAKAVAGRGALAEAIAEGEDVYAIAVRERIDSLPIAREMARALAEWTEQAGDAAAAAEWTRKVAVHS